MYVCGRQIELKSTCDYVIAIIFLNLLEKVHKNIVIYEKMIYSTKFKKYIYIKILMKLEYIFIH
jgi:hypothetical protein